MERAGAMRSLASFYDARKPHVFAISRMTPGDALALATRFSLQWAYRGRQSVFWQNGLTNARCEDPYLPFHLARPLDRRALVRVDVDRGTHPLTIAATQFARTQTQRVPELRFVRKVLRAAQARTVFFAHLYPQYAKFGDLAFVDAMSAFEGPLRIFVRGAAVQSVEMLPAQRGISAVATARLAIA